MCGTKSSVTVAECFQKRDMPLAAPGASSESGAVFSLSPSGPDLRSDTLPPPNIDGVIWRAVTATAPTNGALGWVLNHIIGALYKNPNDAPTIDSILGSSQNDGVVTLSSESSNAGANQFYTFENLSHTSLPPSVSAILQGGVGLNDNSVLSATSPPEVFTLAGCWLGTANEPGLGASCLPGTGSSKISENVPTEPSTLDSIRPVDRLELQPLPTATLAVPNQLVIHVVSPELLRSVTVSQQDELGHHSPNQALNIAGEGGDKTYAEFIPFLLGSVTLRLTAVFSDGGVSVQEIETTVEPPLTPPQKFIGDAELRTVILHLHHDIGTAYYKLAPEAFYASVPERTDASGKKHPVPIDLEDRASFILHTALVRQRQFLDGDPLLKHCFCHWFPLS
jgi:hypothetical protein